MNANKRTIFNGSNREEEILPIGGLYLVKMV
jgi:hypothetical protein